MRNKKLFFTHKPLEAQNNCTSVESYQNLIRTRERSPESLDITGFFGFFVLFPLDGGGGLGGDIVDDTIDALHLVDDAGGDLVQHIVGDTGPVGSHEVAGGDGAERQGVIVGAAVAHDAHGAGIGEDGKVLVDVLVLAGGGDLLPVDGVGIPEGVQLLLGQIADDPDGQAGTGEGLAHDQVFRQAQLAA